MSEFRVDLKVRNNLLLSAIERTGHKNVAQFCKAIGVGNSLVGELLNLKAAPLTKDGHFTTTALKLMEALGALPEDLWTEEQMTMSLDTNKAHVLLDKEALALVMDRVATGALEFDTPEEALAKQDTNRNLETLLDYIPPHCKKVLIMRSQDMTLEEIAQKMDLTRERVRQIEAKGIRIMKNYAKLKPELGFEPKADADRRARLAFLDMQEQVERIRQGLHPEELKEEA